MRRIFVFGTICTRAGRTNVKFIIMAGTYLVNKGKKEVSGCILALILVPDLGDRISVIGIGTD